MRSSETKKCLSNQLNWSYIVLYLIYLEPTTPVPHSDRYLFVTDTVCGVVPVESSGPRRSTEERKRSAGEETVN